MTLIIQNADKRLLDFINLLNMDKKSPYKITQEKSSPKPKCKIPALDKAIKEYKNGQTYLYKDFKDYKANIDE